MPTQDRSAMQPGTPYSFGMTEPLQKDKLPKLLVLLMVIGYAVTLGFIELAGYTGVKELDTIGTFLMEGGQLSNKVFSGQIWRLLTHAFLHGGMFHIFGNLVMFGIFTMCMRTTFCKRGWLWVFLGSAVLGGLVTICLRPEQELVGASIGIMGVLGALLAAELRKRRIPLDKLPATNQVFTVKGLLIMIVLQFVLEQLIPNVGHVGHASGMAVGFLMGLFFPLSGGLRILTNKPTAVKVVNVQYKTRNLPKAFRGRTKDQIVKEVTFEFTQEFDFENDVLSVIIPAYNYRGRNCLSGATVGTIAGKLPHREVEWTAVASCFAIAGKTLTEEESHKLEEKDEAAEKKKAPPLAFKVAMNLFGLVLWYLLYQWWSEDLLWEDAQLQWLNFLPAAIAVHAISLVKISGALLVTLSAALMIKKIAEAFGGAFLVAWLESKKGTQRDRNATKGEATLDSSAPKDEPNGDINTPDD